MSISYGGKSCIRNCVLCWLNTVEQKSILASTNLSMEPLDMIRLYSYRFRIECAFRELTQQIGGFCYHFWSKGMPKLNRYLKKRNGTSVGEYHAIPRQGKNHSNR